MSATIVCDEAKMHRVRNGFTEVQRYAYAKKDVALIELITPLINDLADAQAAEPDEPNEPIPVSNEDKTMDKAKVDAFL